MSQPRFEYMETPVRTAQWGRKAQKEEHARLGWLGWELVAVSDAVAYWKRQMTEAEIVKRQRELAREEHRRISYHKHLEEDHECAVYIGNVEEIHRDNYPDCNYAPNQESKI